jgi:hypothetical protein
MVGGGSSELAHKNLFQMGESVEESALVGQERNGHGMLRGGRGNNKARTHHHKEIFFLNVPRSY